MLLSMVPTVFAAETTNETDFAHFIEPAKRNAGTYRKVTTWDGLLNGDYILLAEAKGTYAQTPYYVVLAERAGNYFALESVNPGFESLPQGISLKSGGEAMAFHFTISEGYATIKDYKGNYLLDDTDDSGYGLILDSGLTTWTMSLYDDGSWTLLSSDNHYLTLRDDIDTVGNQGNPVVYVTGSDLSTASGSCYFFLYRRVDTTTCTHSYTYTSNGDGTHEVGCSLGCGYAATEDCTMSGGVCTLCDYEEAIEYTVTFVVPEGVTAPEPITGSSVVLPVPSGSPNYNYNNATFIGWTNTPVNYTAVAPTIYNTTSTYTLAGDGTLYALYSYNGGNTFVLFDGSKQLSIGDQVIIVARDFDYALSRTQNGNNRAAAPITTGTNTVNVDPTANVSVLSVGSGVNGSSVANEYSFHDSNGYLAAGSSTQNRLISSGSINANSTWTYTLASDATITLTSQGEYTRNTIRYNTSELFSCYAQDNANLKDIQLYVLSGSGTAIYTTTFTEQSCTHEYSYTSNGDGTHKVNCTNGCGYSATEDCSMSGGVCIYCDYEEIIEYTVEFVVPSGVEEIEPIVGSEVSFPVAVGEPDNNSNNAIFIGWTTEPVDNSSVAPFIYDTNTVYTLEEDMTLYALYGYGGNMIFELYNGSSRLNVGDRVIIVAAEYDQALSKNQKSNNRASTDIVKDGTSITISETGNVAVFTVDYGINGSAQPSQISLLDDQGYLTSASSSSNYLRTSDELTANSTWLYTIAPDTYQATITSQGDYTRNTIRYNTSSLFSAYDASSTTVKGVQIYILTENEAGFYTTVFYEEEECLHEYMYSSNGDGTHNAVCVSCEDTYSEDCDLTSGECPYCGYAEVVEYTVNFVVPAGVNKVASIKASEAVFPVPTGTPDNNYNNATFIGWVSAPVNNSQTAPNYYDTVSTYTLDSNMTLYALYRYGSGSSGNAFTLYDGSQTLREGADVIIVASDFDYAIGAKNTNNRAVAEIVKNGNTVTFDANAGVTVFTLGWGVDGTSDTLSFKDDNGYLRAASSSANQLKSGTTLDASSSWAYSVDEATGNITLTSQGTYTRNTIRYNKSSTLFSCYAADNTNQFDVQLYIGGTGGAYTYTTVFDEQCPHSNTSTETIPATCLESGSVTVSCNSCGAIVSSSVIAALGHDYDTQVQEPTCTQNGYVIYTCINCGDVYSEELISEGHNYDMQIQEPTCTENGYTIYTCPACGDVYSETTASLGHRYTTEVLTQPTCLTDGLISYHCIRCDDSYTETVTAEGHSYGNGVVTSILSCTTDGVTTYTCSKCGDSYSNTVPAKGHAYGSGEVVTVMTCTTDGLTKYTCANCADVKEELAAAPGHDYDDGVMITVPTCLQGGTIIYTCGRCNDSKTETLAATGHNYVTTVCPPTCFDRGYTNYLCTSCGDNYTSNYIAPTGHIYDIIVIDPTCVENGYTSFVCPGCGDSYTADIVQAVGHNYSVQTTEATCTQNGSKVYSCANCGDTYTETIAAAGHQITFVPEVPASCNAEGTMAHYTCAVCMKYFIDEQASYEVPESYLVLSATGHTLVHVAQQNATCTQNGNMEYYRCSGCNKHYIDNAASYEVPAEYVIIAAGGHSYKATVTAPTCTTDGYTTHTCYNCGDTYTSDTVAAFGHNYSFTDNGETHTRTCSNCGDSITQAHDWKQAQDLTEGTCSAYSKILYSCSICSVNKIVENGKPNHDLTFCPETYATCESEGFTEHYACSQCGKYFADSQCSFELPESYVKSPALGHSYVYTNNGSKHTVICANCDLNTSDVHKFENGTCVCGALEGATPTYKYDSKLSMTMNVSVGVEMQVMYTILNARVKNYESFYVEVVKDVAGGESVKTVFSLSEGNLEEKLAPTGALAGYGVTYTGIFAMEMGDNFTATLYCVAEDGTIYYGPASTSSIKSYLMEKLADSTSSAELKTLAVDMLNYGAAAQINFNYDVNNLVNADLTAAQKALGTQGIPAAADRSATSGNGGKITANVSLQSKVLLYVNCTYAKSADSKLEFVVKNTNGDILERFAPSVETARICQGIYANVGARQMRDLITIELYDNGKLVSQTLTWNIESYVAQTRSSSASSEALIATVNAMLAYGDSAAAYLSASGQ